VLPRRAVYRRYLMEQALLWDEFVAKLLDFSDEIYGFAIFV